MVSPGKGMRWMLCTMLVRGIIDDQTNNTGMRRKETSKAPMKLEPCTMNKTTKCLLKAHDQRKQHRHEKDRNFKSTHETRALYDE
jgi:hypothetical protein